MTFIAALAAVQAWFGEGDASATGQACSPFAGDPTMPMVELLTPPEVRGKTAPVPERIRHQPRKTPDSLSS